MITWPSKHDTPVTRKVMLDNTAAFLDSLTAVCGAPTRLSFADDVKRLKDARIRHVADLQPWLNLLDLPGAA